MLKAIEAYLALRRATGFAMLNAECLLRSFAAFATERGQTHVHAPTAIEWAACAPSVAQRDARLKSVCRFVRHVRVEDARHELPPVNHFGARRTRRSPHIYSAAEIDRLIEAALRLRPKGGLRPRTYATLIALLSVIRKVSLWLGHATLTTTEIYTRGDPTEKLDAMESIVPPHLRRGAFQPSDKLIALLRRPS
jgi:integrase